MRARSLVCGWVFLALAAAQPIPASAQSYPTRPIKLIVPTPAGGPVDVAARVVAQYLSNRLGQSVVVDNRPGAGNTIGSKAAAAAEPDGYTLLFSSASGLVISPMLQKNVDYDPVKSFAPIALVSGNPLILVVNPTVAAKTVAELVSLAKSNPGKVNFSSGGIGTLPHLTGELFKSTAGISVVHVPYRGGAPSIADVVGGQVQMTFEGTSVLLPLIRDGKLRALAITSPVRIAALPDVPTMAESGYPSFTFTAWTALLAPAGTPADIVARLNRGINEGLGSAELREPLARLSSEPIGGTPQAVTRQIENDTLKWAPVVKALGLKVD
jgi:tripartite-type tricarboxylate transporter receptor subunit TctC